MRLLFLPQRPKHYFLFKRWGCWRSFCLAFSLDPSWELGSYHRRLTFWGIMSDLSKQEKKLLRQLQKQKLRLSLPQLSRKYLWNLFYIYIVFKVIARISRPSDRQAQRILRGVKSLDFSLNSHRFWFEFSLNPLMDSPSDLSYGASFYKDRFWLPGG